MAVPERCVCSWPWARCPLLVSIATAASAGAVTPGEGSGSGWCSAYGGTNQGSFDNVYACSPNGSSAGSTPFDLWIRASSA